MEVVRLHGLLKSIVSNYDTKFIGHFWRTLSKKLCTILNFSSPYHPKIDGWKNVVDKCSENSMRFFIGDKCKRWDWILPYGKFAYNDSNTSIGKSPLQIIFGDSPRGISYLRSYLANAKGYKKSGE